MKQIIITLLCWCCAVRGIAHTAATPTFSMVPIVSAPATIAQGQVLNAMYFITNNTGKQLPGNGVVNLPPGVQQISGSGNCGNLFDLPPQGGCLLQLQITANELTGNISGGPEICQIPTRRVYCSLPSAANAMAITFNNVPVPAGQAIITNTPASLEFVVGGPVQTVTVTNVSATSVQNLAVTIPSSSNIILDALATTCNVVLQANASCTYGFLPGITPETNTVVTIAGSNTVSAVAEVITVTPAPPLEPVLYVFPAALALQAGGQHRLITFYNIGTETASGLTLSVAPALPAGTTITFFHPDHCSTMAPGNPCGVGITPGATPSAAPGDLNPQPVIVSLRGNGIAPVASQVSILTYGSVYQGGFVFDIEDIGGGVTPSMGGKVLSLVDVAPPGVIWSANSSGSLDYFNILGITETATTPSSVCNGASDGACDTAQIVDHYASLDPSVNPQFYAAGVCDNYAGGGYSDWYLPAVCEWAPGDGSSFTCTIQNITTNILTTNVPNTGLFVGSTYWTATEWSTNPTIAAWVMEILSAGGVVEGDDKGNPHSVRCVRQLSQTEEPTTLVASVQQLALAINGARRKIIITNVGDVVAFNVLATPQGSEPPNNIAIDTCGSVVPPRGTCTLTIIPGGTATAPPGNLTPSPYTFTVAGTATNTLTIQLNVLDYGSVYEGGFVFAIDDTTPVTTGIGGTVLSLVDVIAPSTGIIWSSNGNGGTSADVDYFDIPGITDASTTPSSVCNGADDGACDTGQIVAHYTGVNPQYYAAGVCNSYAGSGYTGWYLLSICEWGVSLSSGAPFTCTVPSVLTNILERNIQNTSLSENTQYWSATEARDFDVVDPTHMAWQTFMLGSSPYAGQSVTDKSGQLGVRCARAIT